MDADRSAERYQRLQLRLTIAALVVDTLFLLAMAWGGGAHALVATIHRFTMTPWVEVASLAVALGVLGAALGFPLAWIRGYHLPRRYRLLHQPLRSWLADRAKAAALAGTFALVGVEAIYALLRATDLWWLVAAAVFWVFSIAVATIFPVWIVPLFYRLTPLGDANLKSRLLALAARVGITAVAVFVVDQSRKARTANAALAGLGRTRRIILFDTLVTNFTPEEIESVVAHELAHHVHGDLWRGLAAQGVVTIASFWIVDRVLRATAPAIGLSSVADPVGLPWIAIVMGAVGLLALPLANGLSRRMERRADDFALATTGDADAFVGAMERLASLNLAERRPSRWKELILYSHPALERRIARARAQGSG